MSAFLSSYIHHQNQHPHPHTKLQPQLHLSNHFEHINSTLVLLALRVSDHAEVAWKAFDTAGLAALRAALLIARGGGRTECLVQLMRIVVGSLPMLPLILPSCRFWPTWVHAMMGASMPSYNCTWILPLQWRAGRRRRRRRRGRSVQLEFGVSIHELVGC